MRVIVVTYNQPVPETRVQDEAEYTEVVGVARDKATAEHIAALRLDQDHSGIDHTDPDDHGCWLDGLADTRIDYIETELS
jgi:hypothetical protein